MKNKKVEVVTNGIVGTMWCLAKGFLPRGEVVYSSSKTPVRKLSLYELCDHYLMKHGGDFMNCKLAGLEIIVTEVEVLRQSPSISKRIVTVKTYIPHMEELKDVVDFDWMDYLSYEEE